jgi:hemolysin activation/secretion protein
VGDSGFLPKGWADRAFMRAKALAARGCGVVAIVGLAIMAGLLASVLGAAPARATGYELVPRPAGFRIVHRAGDGGPQPDLTLKARFGKISIVGGFAGVEEALRPTIDQLSGRDGTAGDLFTLAAALQAGFQKAGYALARVYLPAQDVGGGRPVELHVIDVAFDGIDKRDIPHTLQGRVDHHLAGLVGRSRLMTREVQQAFAALQLETGLTFKQEIAPSGKADKARLKVVGEGRAWTGSLSFVHTAGYPAQRSLVMASYTFANPLGFGDRLSVTAAASRRRGAAGSLGPYGALTAAHQFPLFDSGLLFESYGTLAQERRRSRGPLQLDYGIWRGGARMLAPVVAASGSLVVLRAGVETMGESVVQRDATTGLLIEATQRYRAQSLRAGVLWSYASGGFLSEGMLEGSVGRYRSETNLDPYYLFNPADSRRRREGSFAKIEGLVRFEQELPGDFKLEGLLRSQHSFGGLLAPNEQLQLLQGVSLIPSTSETAQGERGMLARVEISRRFRLDMPMGQASLSPFVFAGVGRIAARDQVTDVMKRTRGVMYGGGLRFTYRNLSASLEGFHLEQSGNVRSHRGVTLKFGTSF